MLVSRLFVTLTPTLSRRARGLDPAPFSFGRRAGDEGLGIVRIIKSSFLREGASALSAAIRKNKKARRIAAQFDLPITRTVGLLLKA